MMMAYVGSILLAFLAFGYVTSAAPKLPFGSNLEEYPKDTPPLSDEQLMDNVEEQPQEVYIPSFVGMTNPDAVTPGGMIAVKHQWPAEPVTDKQKGYYNLDTYITINKEPTKKSYYFWAQQFWFDAGDGGYMGLQTGGSLAGKEQKIAIFSIWKALDAKPGNGKDAHAGTFGGEGVGYQCKIAYDWKEGTEYRLRLFEIADARKPKDPEWWGAWVMDMSTKKETFIGQIQVPGSWNWMTSSTNFFVEYFLSVPSCNQIPYAKATLHMPTRENGRVCPTGAPSLETYGKCKSAAKVRLGAKNSAICETGTP